mmetsp:Transcript_9491/g.14112  ORF Transcript_9491/g.14112 Transcript_9491/m.14112 type:complete len:246 (-) Transcript_9491:68-805(-)
MSVPMPTSLLMRSTAMSSFGPGLTNSATSHPFGSAKGPLDSESSSSANFAAKPFFFFFFPSAALDAPFLLPSTLRMRHCAVLSPFHLFRARLAIRSSLNMTAIFSPPTGWNMSTNNRANSRSDVSKVSRLTPSSSCTEDFFFCPPFSTPNFAPTGISISIRDILPFNASCTLCRQTDTASLTSFGRATACNFVRRPSPDGRIVCVRIIGPMNFNFAASFEFGTTKLVAVGLMMRIVIRRSVVPMQ